MKSKLLITASLMLVMAVSARADANANAPADNPPSNGWWNDRFYYDKNPENRPLFHANELTMDFFASYLNPEHNVTAFPNTDIHHGTWGGGVGANYFWSKDVGIGVDTSFQTESSVFVDHVAGNLLMRIPFDCIHLAPYAFAGGGRGFSPIGSWFGDVGAGLEFRFNRNLGIFADGRYIWHDRVISFSGTREQGLFRTGLRVGF